MNISEGTNYFGAGNATVTIADNDTPTIDISTVIDTMYERLTSDYVRFRLTRRGDLNAANFDVNLTYAGAAATSRHTGTTPVTVNSGSLTTDFDVSPVNDSLLQGDQTIICTVAAGTGYAVGTTSPSATATILDDELPAETVLFADNFNTDSSANWTLRYASTNSADNDYSAMFAYDYSTYPVDAIPPAPHSGTDTHGLFLQVNKVEPTEAAAALNLYPKNKTFSGNFALRFDMYLIVPTIATTEYALFGINHSGNQTNWFRNSTAGFTGVDPTGWTFDGLFYGVETDAGALGDYALYSAPTTAGRQSHLAQLAGRLDADGCLQIAALCLCRRARELVQFLHTQLGGCGDQPGRRSGHPEDQPDGHLQLYQHHGVHQRQRHARPL